MQTAQRLSSSVSVFACAAAQSTDLVAVINASGKIEYANDAFTEITGYALDELCEKTTASLCAEVSPDIHRRAEASWHDGKTFHEELIGRHKNGTKIFLDAAITAIKSTEGRTTHFVVNARDITHEKHFAERAQLRQEQLTRTAHASIVDEIIATVAHEASQPLTAIINYTNGCIRRTAGDGSTHLLPILEQILAQAERAADSITSLRRRIGSREPRRLPVDINTLISQTAASIHQRDTAVTLDLSEGLPPAIVDAANVEQVILHLLENSKEAIANSAETRGELKISTLLRWPSAIEVSVSDTGIAPAPHATEKLFDAFFTTKPDHIGLGLTISRSIIEAHGGRLWATRNPHRGMTFSFTLPIEAQSHG